MKTITSLPFTLRNSIPINHVYVGMGREFVTNGNTFNGFVASTTGGLASWIYCQSLTGEDDKGYYCAPRNSAIAKLNIKSKSKSKPEYEKLSTAYKALKKENDALKAVLKTFVDTSAKLTEEYAALKATQINSHPADGC